MSEASRWLRSRRLGRPDVRAEVDEELRFHLEMRARELADAGLDESAAQAAAEHRFGEFRPIRNACIAIDQRHLRRAHRTEFLTDMRQDLHFALRSLARRPGFTIVAVLTLAIGIGAATAMFSVANGVLLRPLPYADADRVVRLWNRWQDQDRGRLSPPEYVDVREGVRVYTALGVYAQGTTFITGGDEPERLSAAVVNAGLFPALGIQPALGRVFTQAEEQSGAPRVAILSHALWQRRFGGDRAIVGQAVSLGGNPTTVVGVMPPTFRLPEDFRAENPTDVLVPLTLDGAGASNRGSHYLLAVARLAPGVSLEEADAAMRAYAERAVAAHPEDYPERMRFTSGVISLRDDVAGAIRPALLLLLGAVGLLLLIACVNMANLYLARTEARAGELAVRTALGAGRGRLVRQLLVESVLLALIGGALGVLLAAGATRALVQLRPANLPRVEEIGVDAWALGFAFAAALVASLLFGLLPALRASRSGLRDAARGGIGREATAGASAPFALRRALVIAEVSLALVLLAGAGLLTRSFAQLLRVDPGFRSENVLTAQLTVPSATYPEEAQLFGFYEQLLERLNARPEIAAAGAVSSLPLANPLGDLNIRIEGREVPEGEVSPRADWQVVTPGYFEAMGMRLLRGRGIEPRDAEGAPGAVVINEAMAARYWPDENPIGQRFTLGARAGPGEVTIVGIVRDVRHGALSEPPKPEMYLPHRQFRMWGSGAPIRGMTLVLQTPDTRTASTTLRHEVRELDPNLPVGTMLTMEAVRARSIAQPRFTMLLLTFFSAAALVLAAVGIYGVMTYAVARRTREIGIRIALGARQTGVEAMVLQQGMVLVLVGIVLGLAGALALSRLLRGLLFEVSTTDAATLGGVAVFLTAVALVACWIPARRAARVDPMVSLRGE